MLPPGLGSSFGVGMMGTGMMRHVSRFLRDRSGNFAIITAVAIPVLAGSAGIAIDASNMIMSRSQLQVATDAAALAAATAMANGSSSADGQTLASDFVKGQMANYLDSTTALNTTAQISQTTTSDGTNYSVVVNSNYSMSLNGMTRMLGMTTTNISAASTSTSGTSMTKSALSMYLVLDRSGSMGDDTDTVNADQPTTTSCTKTNKYGECTKTKTVTNYYTKIESLKIAVANLTSQLQKADPKLQYVRTGGDSYSSSADATSDLAWGESTVLAYVNKLTASGNTDSSGAFANAYNALMKKYNATTLNEDKLHKDKNGQVPTKYIVFMTDGDNNQSNADKNTKASCDDARDAGIQVYTIAFMAPSNGQALLKYCATTTADYFTPQNADDLIAAFQSIGQQASKQLTLLTK
jgi:Flp pilus assembly protein TadG